MSNRLTTGIEGLDAVLGGGFLRHNSILVKGAPGAGKTSLGVQMLMHGIEADEEGAVICSFEQFPQQLERDMAAFGWDLQALQARNRLRLAYLRPDDLVAPPGAPRPSPASRIVALAEEVGARRLLLDSITHFNRIAQSPELCRAVVLEFVNTVKAHGITPILTAELPDSTGREYSFEEYLVDEVVLLHLHPHAPSPAEERSLEIAKSRGHAHAPGRHPFQFTHRGIQVYPRIFPEPFAESELANAAREPLPSGVGGIDALLGGGYPRGRATILAGMAGCYKTSLAAAFLAQGARQGRRALLITFQETPSHLLDSLAARGIALARCVEQGQAAVRHYLPGRNSLEQVFHEMQGLLSDAPPECVAIDGLGDFQRAAGNDVARARDYLAMFLAALARSGATTLLTMRLTGAPGADPLGAVAYADMADTVLYLGNVEIESCVHKVVSVPKSRGARAQSDLREILCDADGLRVCDKFHGLSGILQGAAHGRYKQTVENIFQPLYFIRDFARMGAGEQADESQRRAILADIARQIETLDASLKDYFGFDPEETKHG